MDTLTQTAQTCTCNELNQRLENKTFALLQRVDI